MDKDTANEVLIELQMIRMLLELSSKDLKKSIEDRLAQMDEEIKSASIQAMVSSVESEAGYNDRLKRLQENHQKLLAYSQHFFI